jgi:hypothetical protein
MATFHKIDKESTNAITNALSIFDIPSTNVSVSGAGFREYLTLNPLTDVPYHFKIHASTNYIDLSKCYLLMECRIRKKDGTGRLVDLADSDDVSVCQLLGHTIWKNCRININGTQVFEGNSLMAYKSILDYELTYSENVKNSYLSVAGYLTEQKRKALFAESNIAQFMAKLNVDLCNQPRYLVNQCEIDIELLPNDSNFILQAASARNYVFELITLKLYVKNVELVDSLAYDINKKLELRPARYPMRKTSIKTMFIGEDTREYNGCLWIDQIPRRVVLALVKNKDFVGDMTTNPFRFQPFNLREITITANGTSHPQAPYSLDFPNNKYARAFHDTMEAIGYAGSMESNGISMEDYKDQFCFFVFNLTNSKEDNGDTFDLIKPGSTLIKISFSSAVEKGGYILVAMAEVDSILMLDRNRTISTDITV